jgi:long-chain fatty acid transport protein
VNTTSKRILSSAIALAAALPASAWATNGYFSHGWGTKSKAMAGVATALPQDTLVSATNPAGMAFLGQRFDLGVSFFNPSPRGYEANSDFSTGPYPGGPDNFPTGGFVTPGRYDSDTNWFLIPSLGYNHQLNERSTIGISIYGNGGMNTDYSNAVWRILRSRRISASRRSMGNSCRCTTSPAVNQFLSPIRILPRFRSQEEAAPWRR